MLNSILRYINPTQPWGKMHGKKKEEKSGKHAHCLLILVLCVLWWAIHVAGLSVFVWWALAALCEEDTDSAFQFTKYIL